MKTNKTGFLFRAGRMLPVVATIVMSALILVSCSKDDDDNNIVNNNPYTVSGNGSGSQVVPAVSGTGTSRITGTYNPVNGLLSYTANWDSLSGAPTSAGFYTGAAGASGMQVGSGWTFDSTATATGSRSDTITLTSDQATQLLNGNWYYSYGTATNPGGEVRGQISATR